MNSAGKSAQPLPYKQVNFVSDDAGQDLCTV